MLAIDRQIASEYWEICNAAYECWLVRRTLFDDNVDLELLGRSHCAGALAHIALVTQRDVLHQIAKLHDPAKQFGQNNLSIGFIVESIPWDRATYMRLHVLKAKLDGFAEFLRSMRHKLTAHNDLETRIAARPLGQFPAGADIEYFKQLQEFVEVIFGGPRPFNSTVRNDAQAFVESLVRGARGLVP